jgi:hypothetical protein
MKNLQAIPTQKFWAEQEWELKAILWWNQTMNLLLTNILIVIMYVHHAHPHLTQNAATTIISILRKQ